MDVIAIDPGLQSGCAHVRYDASKNEIAVLHTAELAPLDCGVWLTSVLSGLRERDMLDDAVVVLERFTITPKTGSNSQAPWSLEIIGQSRWIAYEYFPDRDPQILLQSPADAKTAMPNDRLRSLGMWHRGGNGHALDALRHAGLHLLRQGVIPPRG